MDEEAEVAEELEEEVDSEEEYDEEYEGEPDGEDEPEPEGDAEGIPIDFEYEFNGQKIKERLNYDQVANVLSQHKQYEDTLQKQNTYIAGVAPVADIVLNRPMFAKLMQYAAADQYKGWSDEAIIEGVLKLYKQNTQPQDFETVQDEINYRVAQETQKMIAPYAAEMQRIKVENESNKVFNDNMRTINDALTAHGYSPSVLNDEYAVQQIMDAINTFNPQFDARKDRLPFNSAKGVINYALKQRNYKEQGTTNKKASPMATQKKPVKFTDIAKKRAEVPKIGGGKAGGTKSSEPERSVKTYAKDTDRMKVLNSIFNSK